MIKTMYLSCFRSAQSWFFVVKLEWNTKLIKKTDLVHFDRLKLRLDQLKIVPDVFFIRFSNSALKCFNWFMFLIYPRYIRETLVTFLCYSYCGLCESLVRSLRRFPSHKLRIFKEKIFLHLDDHSSCSHWSLKKTQAGVLVFGGESKKEEVRGFGACTWSCQ